jgi:hypothetical protein
MEDFIPYELAKKLEEKGFKTENTNWCYLDRNLVQVKKYVNISPYEYAPTISQVLKWLREEKKIYIAIDLWFSGYAAMIYTGISKENNNFNWKDFYNDQDRYETAEQAALAGIEYVIDNNLI